MVGLRFLIVWIWAIHKTTSRLRENTKATGGKATENLTRLELCLCPSHSVHSVNSLSLTFVERFYITMIHHAASYVCFHVVSPFTTLRVFSRPPRVSASCSVAIFSAISDLSAASEARRTATSARSSGTCGHAASSSGWSHTATTRRGPGPGLVLQALPGDVRDVRLTEHTGQMTNGRKWRTNMEKLVESLKEGLTGEKKQQMFEARYGRSVGLGRIETEVRRRLRWPGAETIDTVVF